VRASVFTLRLDAVEFWRRAIDALDFADLMQGLMKPVVFGFIFGHDRMLQGLTVREARRVWGEPRRRRRWLVSVLIIVADTFMTKLSLFFRRQSVLMQELGRSNLAVRFLPIRGAFAAIIAN